MASTIAVVFNNGVVAIGRMAIDNTGTGSQAETSQKTALFL